MNRRILPSLLVAMMVIGGIASCKKEAPKSAFSEPAPAESDVMTQQSESGPVKATVTLSPKKPRLGDQLILTLSVEAQAGVRVEMPPFGEALGRFSISSFTPRTETAPDGTSRLSQRYVLESPMSGHQRIPALRIEFTDSRKTTSVDGGADSVHEILTDEVSIDIASVLPEEANKTELRGLRGPLEEGIGRKRLIGYIAAPLLLVLLGASWWFVRRLRRRAQLRVRVSAYDVAMQRLAQLKGRGWPGETDVDAFYVELSDIVRRYIEDRYGVRAPELTTEEFLRAAQSELRLKSAQRELLEAFLSTCDRVKFAGYRPGEFESRQAFGEASRFLDDTRLSGPPSAAAPEARA